MKQCQASHLSHSVEWANNQLRFGIKLLKGSGCSQSLDRAVSDAISIRQALANAGFWWQAKTLDHWIHLVKKKGDFIDSKARVGEPCVQEDSAEGEFTARSDDPEQSEGEGSP